MQFCPVKPLLLFYENICFMWQENPTCSNKFIGSSSASTFHDHLSSTHTTLMLCLAHADELTLSGEEAQDAAYRAALSIAELEETQADIQGSRSEARQCGFGPQVSCVSVVNYDSLGKTTAGFLIVQNAYAQLGYTTSLLHNVSTSIILYDELGWSAKLQEKSRKPNPKNQIT